MRLVIVSDDRDDPRYDPLYCRLTRDIARAEGELSKLNQRYEQMARGIFGWTGGLIRMLQARALLKSHKQIQEKFELCEQIVSEDDTYVDRPVRRTTHQLCWEFYNEEHMRLCENLAYQTRRTQRK